MQGAKRRMLLHWAALAFACGCYDPAFSDETKCGAGDDCPTGRTCRGGFCVLPGGAADAPLAADAPGTPDAAAQDAAPRDGRPADAPPGGTVHISVVKEGSGTLMTSGGICGSICGELVLDLPRDSQVVAIEARPAPGFYFQRWGGACTGSYRVCTLSRTEDHDATALFAPIDMNLIFVSSTSVIGSFGGGDAVDSVCVGRAADAGLQGTFRALVSTGSPGLTERLRLAGNATHFARGFKRLDGEIVADSATDLVRDHRVRHPVLFDENGRPHSNVFAWTGAAADGTHVGDFSCEIWRETIGDGVVGGINAGPLLVADFAQPCAMVARLICVMVDREVTIGPLPPPPVDTKRIFISQGTVLGTNARVAGDAICDGERDGARALLATTALPGASLLAPTAAYYRPDGVFLGTGAEIRERGPRTGIWVGADGQPRAHKRVWTGSQGFGLTATPETDCDDWSQSGDKGTVGSTNGDATWWLGFVLAPSCDSDAPVYCVDP